MHSKKAIQKCFCDCQGAQVGMQKDTNGLKKKKTNQKNLIGQKVFFVCACKKLTFLQPLSKQGVLARWPWWATNKY